MRPALVFMITVVLLILVPALVNAQSPPVPDKSPQPAIPSKTTPFASPQVQATPQQAYVPQYDTPVQTLVLRAPAVYQIQRQVIVRDVAPVAYSAVACDVGCGVQQQVVQRSYVQHSAVVSHGIVHSAQVNHGLVGAGVGRAPRKTVTKQVTKVKRGLFGGLFGG